MPKIKFRHSCRFANGKPILDNPEAFLMECRKLEGKKGTVSVEEESNRKPKSNEQFKYYWGVVIPILSDYWGYENDEAHRALSLKFLIVNEPGKPAFVASTSRNNWTTASWEEYLDKIRRWALEFFNVTIPLPNEVDFESIPQPYRR